MTRCTLWIMIIALLVCMELLQTCPSTHGAPTKHLSRDAIETVDLQQSMAQKASVALAQPPNPNPSVLLDTFNSAATLNGPSKKATFTIDQSHRITLIQTYHWNDGRGATPGTVSLREESGKKIGPWRCTGTKGQGGVLCFWDCNPDTVIPPGTYRIVVSPSNSWSYNSTSGGKGFVKVEGVPERITTPVKPEAGARTDLSIRHSKKSQTVSFKDKLMITVPPSLLKNDRVVRVAEIPKEQQLVGDDDLYFLPINAFSVTMGDTHEFQDEIILSFKYKSSDLNPNYSAEEQILAYHWDEKRRMWLPIPCTVLPSEQLVQIRTKHLSFFSTCISGVGLAKAAATVGGVAAVGYIGHYAYEQVWLDVYRSSNFVIYYSKGDVNGTASKVTDAKWWPAGRQANVYTAKHPRYVQDLSRFLEEALAKYQSAGFIPPPTPIEVKINSALIQYKANPAGYEHWHGRIHVNTAMAYSPERVKQVTAHELFHAVQSTDRSVAKWWEESTAEYASCMVAWNLQSFMGGGSTFDIYPKLLGLPMPQTGMVAGGMGEIEYDKSYFVSHIVSKGGNLAGAWRVVAADNGDTSGELNPLDRYLKASGTTLSKVYRDFAGYFLFSPSSPIGGSNPSSDCADLLVTLPAPSKSGIPIPPLTKEFSLPAALTTRLLAVQAPAPLAQQSRKISVDLLAKSSDAYADVYLLKGNTKTAGSSTPIASLERPGDSKVVDVKTADVVFIVVTNSNPTDEGYAKVSLSDYSIQLLVSPSAVKDTQGKLDHTFTATAKSIPATVKKLRYRWDFGDKSQLITGTVTPLGGSLSFKGTHKYPKGGRYTVRVELLDATSNSLKLLAKTSVSVEIIEAAQISVMPTSGEVGQRISIQAKGRGLPKNTSYVWEFGDKSKTVQGKAPAVSHTFASAGRYTVSVKALDASTKLVARGTGVVSISQPVKPITAVVKPIDKTKHLTAVRPAGTDSTTIICDLAGSTQYFVTKKMLNYPDPPFEIGLHDKGTTTIDSIHKDFGPAEYKLYKVNPPKLYMDYLMDKSIGTTLVETLSVN